jgi:phosphoribosylformylglycinamidine synthase
LRSQDFGVGEANLSAELPLIGLAATVDCNARYVYLDPYEGAKLAVAEAARNLSCVGAEPLAVTDNLNFGSPETATGYWQLHEACRGIAEACRELSTPVTGGNVSLYNETLNPNGGSQAIYPTPVIGMVGIVNDIQKICGQGWHNVGDVIYLIGSDRTSLGATEYLAVIENQVTGRPTPLDYDLERRVQQVCRFGIHQGWIKSAHDCAEGGLSVAIAESSISGNLAAQIQLKNLRADSDALITWQNLLFGEGASRIVVSVSESDRPAWEKYLQNELPNNYWELGFVKDSESNLDIAINNRSVISLSLAELAHPYNNAISQWFTKDLPTA